MNNYNAGVGTGVSSDTSDPNTAHMRVFVGNLNTPNITKPTLQNIFGKYGAILAISIHRGFAFIQYGTQYAARSAVQGEHNSIIAGQTIDINISSEPKPNQKPALQQNAGQQNFGAGANANTGFEGGWNQTPARGRGGRGGTRGAPGGRGGRGRGAVRGRGAIANKVQSGRVEKSSQAKKKSLLPPLAARAVPVESPVIGSIKSPVKGTIVAATAPDGSQTIDLAMLKQELTDLRDKITQILGFFPANLKLDGSGDTASTEKNGTTTEAKSES